MIWVIILLLLLIVYSVLAYNSLVTSKNRVKNSFARINTELQRRFDLIPNLVETVKGYAEHEKELLENITASRTSYIKSLSPNEKIVADNKLTSNLKSLFAVAENYPELKANENFLKLQDELNETEGKVAIARTIYNDSVTSYNTKLQTFPSSVIANMFHFEEEPLFSVDDQIRENPKIKF